MDDENFLFHPIRIRILQYLSTHEAATTSQIMEQMGSISRASVYNHIRQLEEYGAICVVKENRIRGTVEKVFSVNKSSDSVHAVMNYMVMLMADFGTYFAKPNHDIKGDMLFIDRSLLYLTDDEFAVFFDEYAALCKKYYGCQPGENRKERSLSLISSPPSPAPASSAEVKEKT